MKAVILVHGSHHKKVGELYSSDDGIDTERDDNEIVAVFASIEDFRAAIEKYGGYEQRDFLSEI